MARLGIDHALSRKERKRRRPDSDRDLALIVSGDEGITRMVSIYFGAAGFATIFAETGLEAVKTWKTVEPDVVIIDVGAPHLTGLEFCKWIRMEKGDLKTPVIAIAAPVDSESGEKILRAGANAFLTRPVEMTHLLNIVKRELRTEPGRR
ncbi:MAG: response regulator [Actinobacteria bacterium]|nr:response regulator [Actinomycetota bacterium]MBU1944410.1 response regulator [Actinomycetota bacterium]MBU2688196.1 response regulator [Actinomycetota bacterium]